MDKQDLLKAIEEREAAEPAAKELLRRVSESEAITSAENLLKQTTLRTAISMMIESEIESGVFNPLAIQSFITFFPMALGIALAYEKEQAPDPSWVEGLDLV